MTESEELKRWNNRFGADEYVFGTEPAAFLARQRDLFAPDQKVLMVADGEGRNGVFLAGLGCDVVSVDFSAAGLAKMHKLAATRGVSLTTIQADIATWSWEGGPYDAVIGIFIQFAKPELRAHIFRKMQAALKPGGLLLLHGYTPKQIEYGTGGPSVVENLYTPELLSTAFADMQIDHLAAYDAEISEGAGHAGMSALIDLVAHKRGEAVASF